MLAHVIGSEWEIFLVFGFRNKGLKEIESQVRLPYLQLTQAFGRRLFKGRVGEGGAVRFA